MSKPKFSWRKTACAALLLSAAIPHAGPAQTFTTLVNFDGTDGSEPFVCLVQGTDGNLYGTTSGGGANGSGTVFKMTPSGTLTTLYSFCSQTNCTDGGEPAAGLVLATDGNFYGTTFYGGANSAGTVFKITPGGTLTTLHSFGGIDGTMPATGLVLATDSNLYGTTFVGAKGYGTVFKITSGGTLTTLHSFALTEGENPSGALIQASDGNLYGTTYAGGANGIYGTVFKITTGGALTTLHSFNGTDGFNPFAGLIQAADSNFYGTTLSGGANGGGIVFRITSTGTLTTLYSFCGQTNCTDGATPYAPLVQATDRNLYGTTSAGGGASGDGTVFKVTSGGTLTTLHSFLGSDGDRPLGGLFQATSGTFYDTTEYGGTSIACPSGCGTVFSLAVGLGPFVETVPTTGKVGHLVLILGNNLTGSTSVTFNGTAATFTVVSSTEIKTTVPSGATTGSVSVVTPGGTLQSNVRFRVR
jgi:uncharacterized repeat protein (TIGR03803 family)